MDFHVFSFLVLQSYGKASEKPLLSRYFSIDERILFGAMELLRRKSVILSSFVEWLKHWNILLLSKLSAYCDKLSHFLNWHVACKYESERG